MTDLAALLGTLFLKPALVLAAAAAITACLHRHTAAARHAVWAGAVVATLGLPVLSVVLPPLRVPGLVNAIERSLTEATRTAGSTGLTAPDAGTPRATTGAVPDNGVLDRLQLGDAGSAARLAGAIFGFWIIGALLLGARRVMAEVRLRRILRHGRPVSNPRLLRLLADIARADGMRKSAEIRLSDETTSPAVAGVLRPVILLPAAAETWAAADLRAVLDHELGHVARGDCMLNLLGDLATITFWCNPAVRVAVGRMRAESENACDDQVLLGGVEPEGYAHLLLTLARTTRMHGGHPDAATAMARPRQLETRLLAVLDARVRRHPLPRWMPMGLGGLGLLFALPTAALTLRAAPLQAAALWAPEPDRRADSLAGPASERLPRARDAYRVSPGAAQALAGPDSVLTRRLVVALGHEPTSDADLIRERAAWALAQARDGRLVESLLGALDARDWRVQAYAAWALATARDARAVARLIPLLEHPVWRLRAMAAYALRESGDPRAEAAMDKALVDPAWQVRVEAVGYFGALGGPGLSDRLRPRLDDRHIAVRLGAEHALNR